MDSTGMGSAISAPPASPAVHPTRPSRSPCYARVSFSLVAQAKAGPVETDPASARRLAPAGGTRLRSHVVVQRELVRVRAQPQRVDLVLTLERDPGLDHVRREHAALEQEVVVALQVVQDLAQRARHLRD